MVQAGSAHLHTHQCPSRSHAYHFAVKRQLVTAIWGTLGDIPSRTDSTTQVAQHIVDPAIGEAPTGGTGVSSMQSHPPPQRKNFRQFSGLPRRYTHATTAGTLRDTHPSSRFGPCPAFNTGNRKASSAQRKGQLAHLLQKFSAMISPAERLLEELILARAEDGVQLSRSTPFTPHHSERRGAP